MTSPKIPKLNEEFDSKLLRFIFLRNLPLVLILFLIIFVFSFFMLRYTQPVYEAKTIIQIDTESKAEKVLDIGRYSNEQFLQKLEVLRSKLFIERVLTKLSLDVNYYNEGKFLNHDLYSSSPFNVNYIVYDPEIYEKHFTIVLVNDSTYKLTFPNHNGYNSKYPNDFSLIIGKWYQYDELELVVFLNSDINKPDNISKISSNKYIFEIINPEKLYNSYIKDIHISVLNEFAKTVLISIRDKNATRASDIANQIAQEFQDFEIERKSKGANSILDFIDGQLNMVHTELTKFEDSIINYKRKYNVDTILEIQKQSSLNQVNSLEIELNKYHVESNVLNRLIEEVKAKEFPDPLYMTSLLIGSDYQGLLTVEISKMNELLSKKEQMIIQTPNNSSFIQSLDQQIEAHKNMLFNKLNSIKENIDLKITELTNKYNIVHAKAYSFGNKPHYELKRMERLYSINEQFYNQLIERKIEFSILKAGFVPENIILERSSKFARKVFPNKKKVLLISSLLAFFVSFIIIAFKYLSFNEIVSASEINKYTSVPILGVLPRYPSHISVQQFIVEKYPKSVLAESLRAIRSNLQFIGKSKGSKVLAVTSTISGEGKTFLAVNLAGVFAITGKKAIIIDLDMRKPTVHTYYKLSNNIGMSTILSGQSTISESIQDIGKYDIKFITAGPIPPNPAELLSDERLENLINELKKEYDYIIIDNPPIGLVTDSLKSMQLADYPIYIIRANYSKRTFLSLPEKMLKVYDIKNISIVLNSYDSTISNTSMEKDLVYAYGHDSGYRKGFKNSYYQQDIDNDMTFMDKIKRFLKRDV